MNHGFHVQHESHSTELYSTVCMYTICKTMKKGQLILPFNLFILSAHQRYGTLNVSVRSLDPSWL